MRDDIKLAAAINAGIIRINYDTKCEAKGCDNPLLDPVAFNPRGRVTKGYVCEACNAWETARIGK